MKPNYYLRSTAGLCLLVLAFLASGCLDKSGVGGPERFPSEDKYFGFETKTGKTLSVDYDAPGFWAYVEVYDQDPLTVEYGSYVKKADIEPVYNAYVKDGKLQSVMYVPSTVKEAYLYTERMGLPICVKLEATSTGFAYDAKKAQTAYRSDSRAGTDGSQAPYKATPTSRTDGMYSLCTWDVNGTPINQGYIYNTKLTDMAGLTLRAQDYLDKNKKANGDNKNLLREAKDINIIIPAGGSEVEITFLTTNGSYGSVFGYYYYPNNAAPTTPEEFRTMKKYVVFPDTKNAYLKTGQTAKLKFFGATGIDAPQNLFPEGYTIGWFMIPEGTPWYSMYSDIKQIDPTYVNGGRMRTMCVSNETGGNRQFVSLYDETSKTVVIGVEDLFGYMQIRYGNSDCDYDDLMFFVTTSADIDQEDRPTLPDENPEPEIKEAKIVGTLAFEDVWPSGGDYDLNDVAVEYERLISFDVDGDALQSKETYKFVQRDNAASFDNYFACQVENPGTVTVGDNCVEETSTKSFIITENSRAGRNKSYSITRTYSKGQVKKDVLASDFNPYIIVCESAGSSYNTPGRKEVHLPKHKPTSMADMTLNNTKNDAYYVNRDGEFPFAIEMPIKGFSLSTERTPIDQSYPKFLDWATSFGKNSKDWYLPEE